MKVNKKARGAPNVSAVPVLQRAWHLEADALV
jgi:hypothetical protein